MVDVNIVPGTCTDNQNEPSNQDNSEKDSIITDSTKEIALHSLDFTDPTTSFNTTIAPASLSIENESAVTTVTAKPSCVSRKVSENVPSSSRPIAQSPSRTTRIPAPSPASLTQYMTYQPKTLFVIALKKINEDTLNAKILHYIQTYRNTKPSLAMKASHINTSKLNLTESLFSELPAPDSLTNAPPSYSFVLRQMANRRRPTLMGTFIPSPSFVRQTPPPTYAAAFDIYVDSPIPPTARTREIPYGFSSIPVVCPECGCQGLSIIKAKTTICTHLCAALLCVLCCWLCVPLPYIMKSCKDVYHYCRYCGHYLGMYCPTNPNQENPIL